jgi:hypothetical protein
VLAAAAHDAPVVPLRAGIVYPSDDAVRDELLEPRREQLAQLLNRSEGVAETETSPADAELREILAGDSPDADRR